jgi:hypothetical protein
MCWTPTIKFDGCGHEEPRPKSQISAGDRVWLHEENGQLYRRCPEAARTGVICEDVKPYLALTVNRKGNCGKCRDEKESTTEESK